MERYIAIDNVCAWPNLTHMPNGDIVATIFNQPCHGKWEGDVECWASTDGCLRWERRGVPAPHEPETNRMNVAAGLARNGDLIVISSGWGGEGFRGHTLPPWICRSSDEGRTWRRTGTLSPPAEADRIIPFGDVVQLADGCLGVSGYGGRSTAEGDNRACCFLRSRDDGQTWGEHAVIAKDHNETALLSTDGRRILAAARQTCLDLLVSEDSGTTWTSHGPVTSSAQYPGHFLRLADGQILLTYGIRYRGFYGVGGRLSDNGGETWYTPLMLADFAQAVDGGYPSSVQLADGTIVTAYYASGVPTHTRYHMGVVRWTLDEQSALNRPPSNIYGGA